MWPINESLHFCALTVLAGTVGLFDLRVLGFVKGIAPSTLHATLPWGIAGFVVSVITGVQFIFGAPEQYFYNDAFRLKVVFLVLMGATPPSSTGASSPAFARWVRTTTRRAARRSSRPRRSYSSSP